MKNNLNGDEKMKTQPINLEKIVQSLALSGINITLKDRIPVSVNINGIDYGIDYKKSGPIMYELNPAAETLVIHGLDPRIRRDRIMAIEQAMSAQMEYTIVPQTAEADQPKEHAA